MSIESLVFQKYLKPVSCIVNTYKWSLNFKFCLFFWVYLLEEKFYANRIVKGKTVKFNDVYLLETHLWIAISNNQTNSKTKFIASKWTFICSIPAFLINIVFSSKQAIFPYKWLYQDMPKGHGYGLLVWWGIYLC